MSDFAHTTGLLLGTGLRIWWNKLRRSTWRFRISWALLLGFVAAFAALFAFAVYFSVRFAVRAGVAQGIHNMPGGMLFSVSLFTFVAGFGLALSALYLSSDLDLLLTTPVPIHSIFTAKLVQATLSTYLLVALPIVPSLWAFGHAQGYNPLYYLGLLPVLLILPLLPTALSALAVMLVVRVVPPRRLAEIMGVLVAVLSIGFSIWGQGASTGAIRGSQPGVIFTALRSLDIPFTPPSLAGQALVALGTGDWTDALRGLAGFAALSLCGFVIALDFSASLYYSGWSKVRSAGVRGRPRRAIGAGLPLLRDLLAHPIPALVVKDMRTFPRDLSNLVQILSPLVFSLFWAWQVLRLPVRGGVSGGPLGVLWPLVATLWAVGITGMVFSRMALTGVSREGRTVWILRSAPVTAWQWLLGKFVVAWAPFVTLGSLLVVALGRFQGNTWLDVGQGVLAMTLVSLGVTGIALGIGGAIPRFDWSQPHQMVGYGEGCLSSIAYGVFSGVILVIFAAARLAAVRLPDVSLFIWLAALSLAGLLTLAVTLIPLSLAAQRLENVEA